jgi:hypothetical protein
MSEQRYHAIEIRVPVPDGRAAQGKVIDQYEAELECLYEKLPEGSTKRDWVTTPRAEVGPRKTIDQRVAEKVAEEMAKSIQTAPAPAVSTSTAPAPAENEPEHATVRRVPRSAA